MTYNNRWKEAGLGDSGETYLIGPDLRMRNDSRFLVEAPEGYFASVSANGLAPDVVAKIKSHSTTVGFQEVKTSSAEHALNNETGVQTIEDYRQIPVLSAYAPVRVLNHTWGILTEIDVEEMSAPQHTLTQSILYSALGASGVSIVIAVLVGLGLALYVTKRLSTVTTRMCEIANGSGDLSSRLSETGRDEISEMATNFNRFMQKIHNVIDLVCESSQSLSKEANHMSEHSKTTQTNVDEQQQKILNISTAIEEMSRSMSSIADNTSSATDSAEEAQRAANQGNEVVAQTVESINALAKDVGNAASTVERLSEESKNIESVLSIIHGISEQTNLLALNAAIEAARAGESGRGFAVVADEVRSLSVQIQQETATIGDKISQLQTEARDTVTSIKASHDAATSSVTTAERAGEELQRILQSIYAITEMTTQIAAGVEDQNNNSTVISTHVVSIKEQAQHASEAAGVASQKSNELSLMAGQLEGIVEEVLLSEAKPVVDTSDAEDDMLF